VLTTIALLALGLINIASTAAFFAITGLATVALYTSYILSISLLVLRRVHKQEIPFGPWQLGSLGIYVNCFSLIYSLFVSFWLFFPNFIPVTALNMNYTVLVYGGTFIFSSLAWFFYGKATYRGPLKEVVE